MDKNKNKEPFPAWLEMICFRRSHLVRVIQGGARVGKRRRPQPQREGRAWPIKKRTRRRQGTKKQRNKKRARANIFFSWIARGITLEKMEALKGRFVLVLLRGHFRVCGSLVDVTDVDTAHSGGKILHLGDGNSLCYGSRLTCSRTVEFVGRNHITQTDDALALPASLILDLRVLPEGTSLEKVHEIISADAAEQQAMEQTLPSPLPYTLVDSPETLAVFAKDVQENKHVMYAVDCEGVDLGPEGSVTVLQVATHSHVYIVDVLALGETAFKDGGLREILESPDIVKIMHDCRKDSAALFHRHGVHLQNVFDCQVADLFVRRTLTGLMPGYVKGYANCLRSYLGLSDSQLAIKDRGKELMEDPEVWAKRPISDELLQYCSFDVAFMFTLRHVLIDLMWFDYSSAVQVYLDHCRDKVVKK